MTMPRPNRTELGRGIAWQPPRSEAGYLVGDGPPSQLEHGPQGRHMGAVRDVGGDVRNGQRNSPQGPMKVSSITVTRVRRISGKAILDFCSRTNEVAARLPEQTPHFMARVELVLDPEAAQCPLSTLAYPTTSSASWKRVPRLRPYMSRCRSSGVSRRTRRSPPRWTPTSAKPGRGGLAGPLRISKEGEDLLEGA